MRRARPTTDDTIWREHLTPEHFRALRPKETERPFTREYVHTTEHGMSR